MRRDYDAQHAVITALFAAWLKQPHQRLGQFIVNTVKPSEPCSEIFYIEDNDFIARIHNRSVPADDHPDSSPQ